MGGAGGPERQTAVNQARGEEPRKPERGVCGIGGRGVGGHRTMEVGQRMGQSQTFRGLQAF